jgi:hypothetical protein
VKYAVIDKHIKRSNTLIGQIKMLINSSGSSQFIDIRREHFGSIRGFILDKLLSLEPSEYYRIIINLRLLLEIDSYCTKGGKKKATWGYASAILHRDPRDCIQEFLLKKGYSEKDIVVLVKNEYGLALEEMPEETTTINYGTYTVFEKAALVRELGGTKRINKSILNDIVHLNSQLAICLNPYEYIDYPSYLVDEIEDALKTRFGA